MTGYLFSLNGGAVSWRSSRQGGVTLSSAKAEFVAASQAGQEAIYLRALLRGFNFRQVGATEIWEDNASCIMMSENPANRERTRHVDTRVHYLRELVRNGPHPATANNSLSLQLRTHRCTRRIPTR